MRILTTILSLCLFVTLFAQKSVTMAKGVYMVDYAGTSRDSVTTNDTVWYYEIKPSGDNGQSYDYDFSIKLDSLSGCTGNGYCGLYAKKFSTDSYTLLTNVRYYSSGADTTIKLSQNTNVYYNFFMVKVHRPTVAFKVYPKHIKAYFKTN